MLYYYPDFVNTATDNKMVRAVWSKAAADVPEPGSAALFLLALAGAGASTRLRRARESA